MSMSIIPFEDRVLVKPIQENTVTPGGIHLPDNAREKPVKGKVVWVGPGTLNDKGERVPLDAKADDVVIYSKYAGVDVKVEGEDCLILRQADLLAKIVEA